jgi:hypothetical protein
MGVGTSRLVIDISWAAKEGNPPFLGEAILARIDSWKTRGVVLAPPHKKACLFAPPP